MSATKIATRTLIVDDEQPARGRLRQLLESIEGIEIVGEAEDGLDALEKIHELTPDLVLLDIQMPVSNGLEVAVSLPSPAPKIIFCTAYDQYAIDAFDLHAVDYLLKPVTKARLVRAVERARDAAPGEADRVVEDLTREPAGRAVRFLARRAAKFRVVAAGDVLYFSSDESLTKLCTSKDEFWMQPTLVDLERRLDPSSFFRVSRSAIVNLAAVHEVVPLVGGYGQVNLKDGTKLEVSRRRLKELLQKLEGV